MRHTSMPTPVSPGPPGCEGYPHPHPSLGTPGGKAVRSLGSFLLGLCRFLPWYHETWSNHGLRPPVSPIRTHTDGKAWIGAGPLPLTAVWPWTGHFSPRVVILPVESAHQHPCGALLRTEWLLGHCLVSTVPGVWKALNARQPL